MKGRWCDGDDIKQSFEDPHGIHVTELNLSIVGEEVTFPAQYRAGHGEGGMLCGLAMSNQVTNLTVWYLS